MATAKQSFLSGFLAKAKADVETVVTDVKKDIEYGADTAVTNIKAEVTKLDTLISSKTESIIQHNKNILSEQNLIKDLEAAVAEAQAVKAKISTALNL